MKTGNAKSGKHLTLYIGMLANIENNYVKHLLLARPSRLNAINSTSTMIKTSKRENNFAKY